MAKGKIRIHAYLISFIILISIFNVAEVQATVPNKKTLGNGETWNIEGGYTLTATEIDFASSPKRVTLTLSENGVAIKKEILNPGQEFNYTNIIRFRTKVDSVFAGASFDMVQLIDSWSIYYNFTLSSTNPSTLVQGDKYTILVSIKNEAPNDYSGLSVPLNCKVEYPTGVWSNEYTINPQTTVDIPLPSPFIGGNGLITKASCYRQNEPTPTIYRLMMYSFETVESPETTAWRASEVEQMSYSDARTKSNSAISAASTSIKEAQEAINDAKNIGADVATAQIFLDSATSKLNSANIKNNEAESFFTAKKYIDAKSSATQSEYFANDALTNAGNAKTAAIQSKEKYSSATPTPNVVQTTEQGNNNPRATSTSQTKGKSVGDFTVGVSPTEITVNPGDTLKLKLSVVPSGGFSEPVEVYVKIKTLGEEKDLGLVKTFYPPYPPFEFENPVPVEIPKGTTIYGYITAKGGGLERNADPVTVKIPGFGIMLMIAAIGMAMVSIKRKG